MTASTGSKYQQQVLTRKERMANAKLEVLAGQVVKDLT
jgi:hypothetical protein